MNKKPRMTQLITRSVKNPKALYRLMRFNMYLKRVRAVESEMGEKMDCC